jgi:hypothetical protein
MAYKEDLAGLVGEHLARIRLQTLGWQVPDLDFLQGNTLDLDLIASSPDDAMAVEFQVKTNTAGGKVHWAKQGRERVDPWIARAEMALSRRASYSSLDSRPSL